MRASQRIVFGSMLALAWAGISGCQVAQLLDRTMKYEHHQFPYFSDEASSVQQYRIWAQEAWAKEGAQVGTFCRQFEIGFEEGFVDYCFAGGGGRAPLVPPRRFWSTLLRGELGDDEVQEWRSGFELGTQVARELGYRKRITLPAWGQLIQKERLGNNEAHRPSANGDGGENINTEIPRQESGVLVVPESVKNTETGNAANVNDSDSHDNLRLDDVQTPNAQVFVPPGKPPLNLNEPTYPNSVGAAKRPENDTDFLESQDEFPELPLQDPSEETVDPFLPGDYKTDETSNYLQSMKNQAALRHPVPSIGQQPQLTDKRSNIRLNTDAEIEDSIPSMPPVMQPAMVPGRVLARSIQENLETLPPVVHASFDSKYTDHRRPDRVPPEVTLRSVELELNPPMNLSAPPRKHVENNNTAQSKLLELQGPDRDFDD